MYLLHQDFQSQERGTMNRIHLGGHGEEFFYSSDIGPTY